MKKILVIAFMTIALRVFSQEVEVVLVHGEEYNIIVPEDYDGLKFEYLRAMKAYLEEKEDFTTLKEAFDEYQLVTDETITSKNVVIKEQSELLIIKDSIIKDLKSDWFTIIPSAYYSISTNGSGGGLGVGFLLFDSFFIQVQGGYPLEAHISAGWKF